MIVLGIDQAAQSGWAVHIGPGGRIVAHGVATTWEQRASVIDCAMAHAGGELSQVLVVFEDHSGISLTKGTRVEGKPTRSTAAILGIGAARGRWDEALDRAGHPESRRMAVEPEVWRLAVLGLRRGASTELCKAEALKWASATLFQTITDHNEAEAIAIASWGALHGLANWEGKRSFQRVRARAKRAREKQGQLDFGGKA